MSLEKHLSSIPEDEDRILFKEAIAAVGAGAKRAGYITLWLSAAECVKRRFRDLSVRDAEAAKIVGMIEADEKAHRAVDKSLLQHAHNYGLITDAEQTKLGHIYEMRCLYGHPYEEEPTDEAISAAAVDVVGIVLARSAKLAKGFLADQVRLITTDKAFLDHVRKTVEGYAKDVADRADPKFTQWFIQKLFRAMEPMAADPTVGRQFTRSVWFAAKYLITNLPNSLVGWDLVTELPKYPEAAPQVFAHPDLFDVINRHAQDYVVNRLLDLGKRRGNALQMLDRLEDAEKLTTRHKQKFAELIGTLKLEFLSTSGLPPRHQVKSIIQGLKSHDWYTQAPAIDALASIGREGIALLDAVDQRLLGNNVCQAADGSCTKAKEMLTTIVNSGESWPEAFIDGIVTECFLNDDDKVRFKTSPLSRAIESLLRVSPPLRSKIVERLVSRIEKGKPKRSWNYRDDRDEMIEIIRKTVARDAGGLKPALRLASSLEKLPTSGD